MTNETVKTEQAPEALHLDGMFFRVQRDGRWVNRCVSDLTKEERHELFKDRDAEWHEAVIDHLCERMRSLAEFCGVTGRGGDEDE